MLRPYQSTDVEAVLNVWAAASAVAYPFLSEAFLALERCNIPNVYLPQAQTWVWEADGRVVGFISLLGNEVGALFVDPQFHRSGIGRALIHHAWAVRGVLEVQVFERNRMGRAFYADLGGEWIGKRLHPETGFELLRLRLPVPCAAPHAKA